MQPRFLVLFIMKKDKKEKLQIRGVFRKYDVN
jgi:hypothetical protein